MLKSNLCDKSDAYIILKGTVTIPGQAADAPAHEVDRAKKQIIFKDCTIHRLHERNKQHTFG